MTIEEKRQYMLKIVKETEEKAKDLYYVICFWMSPISNIVESRRGYFDDINEAIAYEYIMTHKYENSVKYYIATNMSSGDSDGGLLDD